MADLVTFCHAEELAKSIVVPKKRPTSVFKFGAEVSIANDCAHKEKLNFKGFIQNGCYDNHPHLPEVRF